jgi:hypothetical protein
MFCVAICSEITEHAEPENAAGIKIKSVENDCAGISDFPESCPLTTTYVTLQERQTIYTPALLSSNTNFLSRQDLRFVPSIVRKSNVNQNSPPVFSPPLYLQFRAFRI